ncbi:hypothetical protein D3C74_21040 [compost metagenome]
MLKSGKRADAAQIKDIFFIEKTNHEGLIVEIEGYQVPASLAPTFQITVAEASQLQEQRQGHNFSKSYIYHPKSFLIRIGFFLF